MLLLQAAAAVLLCVAAAPFVLAALRSGSGGGLARLALGAAVAVALWRAAGVRESPTPIAGADELRAPRGGYLGSEGCLPCHPGQHRSWQASFHRTMTRVASASSVRADLAGLGAAAGGQASIERTTGRARDPGDPRLTARWQGPGGAGEGALALVTGSHHMESYWVASGAAEGLVAFPWAWLIDDRRWIARGSLFLRPPGPAGPDLPGEWGRACVKCHTTDPRGGPATQDDSDGPGSPAAGPASAERPAAGAPAGEGASARGSAGPHVAELGIGCEACHGPGAEHARANRDPVRRYAVRRAGAGDPTIVLPTRLSHERSSEVCGQCHAVWIFAGEGEAARYHEQGASFRPGVPLGGSKRVLGRATIANEPALKDTLAAMPDFADRYFWRDGAVRVTGREYNGLLESPCYQRGALGCTSCHQLHPEPGDGRPLAAWADDQLRPDPTGEAACRDCHRAEAAAGPAHTHHAAGSIGAGCLGCHMPPTTWGLLGATRSHRIGSPSVRETTEGGRPNACNLCHLDRSLGWASAALATWYRQAPPPLDDDQRGVAAGVLWATRGDAGQRALAAWGFGSAPARATAGEAWMVPILAVLLDDRYDAVRVAAGRSLARLAAAPAAAPLAAGVAYDFAAPAAARQAARHELLQRAYRVELPAGAARPELLQTERGGLDVSRLERLLEWRDERPVALWE